MLPWLLILPLLAAVLMRLIPLFKAPLAAYGYDYGLYFYAFKNLGNFHFPVLLSGIRGAYETLLFFLIKPLPASPEAVLNFLIFFASLLLPTAFYLYFVKQNKSAAIFASLLTSVSIIQSETYFMFLLKTVLALPFLILTFKFLEEKRYVWFAAGGLLIFVTHRTTFIILAITLFLYFAWEELKNQQSKRLGLGLILIFFGAWLAGPKLINLTRAFLNYPGPSRTTGIFLENLNALYVLWPTVILAAFGLIFYLREKKHLVFPIFTGVSLLWIMLRLPFYHRMFIYLDLGLIFFAVYYLGILDYQTRASKIILILFFSIVTYNTFTYLSEKAPLLTREELLEIKNFPSAGGTVLALSSEDAPWLQGFLAGPQTQVYAPGMFSDPHSYEEWIRFWSEQSPISFLGEYHKPLYLYTRSSAVFADGLPCLQKLSQNFSRYGCGNQ